MKRQIGIFSAVLTILLLGSGVAGGVQVQLLPGQIPQFVEPLPLLEFEFINATNLTLPGLLEPLGPGLNGTPFPVDAKESEAPDLASRGWLEEDDPFFDIVEDVVEKRRRHEPRALASPKRAGSRKKAK